MKCKQCGNEIGEKMRFCVSCGAPVNVDNTDDEATVAISKDDEATVAVNKDDEATVAISKDDEAAVAVNKDDEATVAISKDDEATVAVNSDINTPSIGSMQSDGTDDIGKSRIFEDYDAIIYGEQVKKEAQLKQSPMNNVQGNIPNGQHGAQGGYNVSNGQPQYNVPNGQYGAQNGYNMPNGQPQYNAPNGQYGVQGGYNAPNNLYGVQGGYPQQGNTAYSGNEKSGGPAKGLIIALAVVVGILAMGVVVTVGIISFNKIRNRVNNSENEITLAEDVDVDEMFSVAAIETIEDTAPGDEDMVPIGIDTIPRDQIGKSGDTDNVEEPSEETVSEYMIEGSDVRYIIKADLRGFTADECRIARNELYARHGRLFDDEELQAHFDACSWYHGYIKPADFAESMLSSIEMANRDTIVEYEKEMGYR